jgi:hypothetical protein
MNKRKETHLPVGFFDDALADAKARKVNVKEQVSKIQEKEWAEFQTFVAAVEKEETSAENEKTLADEEKEEEALEKLEQMEYLNRVRKTILLVSGTDDVARTETESVEQLIPITPDETDSKADIVAQILRTRTQEQIKLKRIQDEENDDEELDLLDWRAKRY